MVPQNRPVEDSGVASATYKSDLHDLRFEHPKNLLCGYLNINSLRKKIHDLRLIILDIPIDHFVISKTKLENSFPNTHLTISSYKIRARRERGKHGRGLVEFLRKGLICKRLRKYESRDIEVICSKLTSMSIKKKLGHL